MTMRPGRLLVGATVVAAIGWISWNAIRTLPDAWFRYRQGSQTVGTGAIDTTLFQGDSAVSNDTTALSQDTSLTGLLSNLGPELGIARRSIGSVKSGGANVALYSLALRRGDPLPAIAARAMDSLVARGFQIVESTEKPRGTWPWICHLARDGKPVAILRAKIDADPAPGSFGLTLVLWTDSLDAATMAAFPNIPRGTVLALPPRALAEARVASMAAASGLRLALLARLETTRLPVLRQELTRLLLHHQADDIRERMSFPAELVPRPEGLVVIDGDRGAADPGLSGRVADFCQSRSIWLLDATGSANSRLSEDARTAGVAVLTASRPAESKPIAKVLEETGAKAELVGQTTLVWTLDSSSIARIGTNLPLLLARGIGIRPPDPQRERHPESGE